MLFNVKDEAYISFEGSFAQDALPDEIKAQKSGECTTIYLSSLSYLLNLIESLVIAKSRKNFRGFRKPPPISGDSFWQLEKLKDPLSGMLFWILMVQRYSVVPAH